MKHDDFKIGVEFYTAAGKWRCTDIGWRTIAAIRIDDPAYDGDETWLNGPPYAVVEHIFDENGVKGCTLDPKDFI